ncbi:MAG TPA: helix-turn-helix transcriptional regulator [Candidatus Limnocylindrales bacterium]
MYRLRGPEPSNDDALAAIGEALRRRRRERGWSQRELERRALVDQTTICRLERGRAPWLQLDQVARLLLALDLPTIVIRFGPARTRAGRRAAWSGGLRRFRHGMYALRRQVREAAPARAGRGPDVERDEDPDPEVDLDGDDEAALPGW